MIYRIGCTIGLIGGAVFVLVNRSPLPSAWSITALVAWVLLACAAVWAVWIRRRPDGETLETPAPRAGAIYGFACLGMVLLIALGSRLLNAMDQATAVPSLVAMAVGLHFLPFSHAFRAPFFLRLGTVLAVIGAAGIVADFTLGSPAGAAAAVLAGLCMTALITFDALRTRD
ncbi:hypothetical protein [Kytococcus sedentarius]|uniref:hypothetical protein n=1 Tax=Kytococcus sedentarius TaxID=1276 RepID=UPI0035BBBED8